MSIRIIQTNESNRFPLPFLIDSSYFEILRNLGWRSIRNPKILAQNSQDLISMPLISRPTISFNYPDFRLFSASNKSSEIDFYAHFHPRIYSNPDLLNSEISYQRDKISPIRGCLTANSRISDINPQL